MHKPNIFNLETRELSQEAFIGWLLTWGDPETLTINEELYKLSRKLLEGFFNKHNRKLPSNIKKYEISMGYRYIDILLKINGSIIIPIQDKIYNRDSPDQLSRYLQLLKDEGHDGRNILPIYLQTGAQGNYKRLQETGFLPFSRKDLLNILNQGADIKNDILNDYIAYLNEIESEMQSFLNLSLNKWHLYSWQGFYNYLQTELGDGEWDAVSNPSNSFLGFWWYWNNDNDCAQYLQLEKDELCFKIKVDDKKKRADLKLKWRDRFIRASEGSPVKVVKPVFQKDNAITVAIVDGDYCKANKDGKIDLAKTLDVIIEAQKIYDKAVKDVK
jgi:hypothetical protein